MVVIGQSGRILEKVIFFRTKVDVLVQSGCFTAKLVAFGLKWLYSRKMVEIGKKWLYSG